MKKIQASDLLVSKKGSIRDPIGSEKVSKSAHYKLSFTHRYA